MPRVKLPKPEFVSSGAFYRGIEAKRQYGKSFTKRDAFGEPYHLYKKTVSGIYLPREFCPAADTDMTEEGEYLVGVKKLFKARNSEQSRVVAESSALLDLGTSHIIRAPTGFGKTMVALEIARQLGRRFMVIVTKEDIKKQWIISAKKALGLTIRDIGIIQGDKVSITGKQMVIAMIQSICKQERYEDRVFQGFGLIIVDEVHRMAADKFSQAAWNLPAKLRLGLSATVERKDGKDPVFLGHIGRVLVSTSVMTLIPRVVVLKFTLRGMSNIPHSPGRLAILNRVLAGNSVRNKAIVRFVAWAHSKKRSTIIFSETLRHLEILHDYLINVGIPNKDIGRYIGGMSNVERAKSKRKPVILATFRMASEATDIPWADTCVLCSPRSDVLQIVGRVLREHEEKQEPLVLDILDGPSKVLAGYFNKRMRWYRKIGAKVRNSRKTKRQAA